MDFTDLGLTGGDGPATEPTDEIEITPGMISVGARLLADYFDQPLDWLTEERACKIFQEMSRRV